MGARRRRGAGRRARRRPEGPREVARHALTTPGRPSIKDEHYPPRPAGALERKPRARRGRGAGVPGDRTGRRAVADRRRGGGREAVAAQDGRGGRPRQAPRPGGRRGAGGRRRRRPLRDGDLAAILAHHGGEVIAFPARPATRPRCSARLAPGRDSETITATASAAGSIPNRPGSRRRATASRNQRGHDRRSPLRRAPRPSLVGPGDLHAHAQRGARVRLRAAQLRRTGRADRRPAMTVKPPAPPPLPDELDRLLRRLRLPYVRRAAPDVIATAQPTLGTRRSPARPARRGGRRPRPGDDPDAPPRLRAAGRQDVRRVGPRRLRRSPRPPSTRCARWNGSTAPRSCASAGPAAPARATSSRRSAISRSTRARPSPGTRSRRSRYCCAATAPTTASTKRSAS